MADLVSMAEFEKRLNKEQENKSKNKIIKDLEMIEDTFQVFIHLKECLATFERYIDRKTLFLNGKYFSTLTPKDINSERYNLLWYMMMVYGLHLNGQLNLRKSMEIEIIIDSLMNLPFDDETQDEIKKEIVFILDRFEEWELGEPFYPEDPVSYSQVVQDGIDSGRLDENGSAKDEV